MNKKVGKGETISAGEPEPDAQPEPGGDRQPNLQIKRLSGGSERRCNLAKDNLTKALDAYRVEMDRQIFTVDDDGKRAGPWGFLDHCDVFKDSLNVAHNDLNALRNKMRTSEADKETK